MTIQEAAQKVLLIFYKRHTSQGSITDEAFDFEYDNEWAFYSDDNIIQEALLESIESAVLLKVALQYLENKRLITFKTRGLLNGDFSAYQFTLTSNGVDVIEGVGGAGNSRDVYQNTFNVNLAPSITVESLIKGELKASVLSLF